MSAQQASDPRPPEGTLTGRADEFQDITVLTPKLVPPSLGAAPVLRPRLLTAVTRGVRRTPVTLISGPAGSGKTVLAASWYHGQPADGSVAWLSLDSSEEDPVTFWAYVREALSAAGVDLGAGVVPAGGEMPSSHLHDLAAALLRLARPVVLVVDDADHLDSREVTAGLDLLVRHAGSRLRLVLCARADPPLPLHRYRLTDALTEIRGDQLAFTVQETAELLARAKVPVRPEVVAALQAETEGWAVGLRLAVAPLKQGRDPEQLVASLATDDGSVAEYLTAEVLAGQPASVRRFLLRTSVAEDLEPGLVDRLAGRPGGQRVLAALAHANAFVEHTAGAPVAYRMHPLFRELLMAQLSYEMPAAVAALHRICATWYAGSGRRTEAAGHAIAAGDWPLATSLLVDDLVVSRVLTHDAGSGLPELDGLPDDLRDPRAAALRSAVALSRGRVPTAADLAVLAAAVADVDSGLPLRVSAAVLGVAASGGGRIPSDQVLGAAEDAAALVAALPDEYCRGRRELAAVLAEARAEALLRSDTEDRVLQEALQAALAASEAVGSRRLRGRCLGGLALVEALQGHLRRADHLAARAEALFSEGGERQPRSVVAAAWVCVDRHELADARRWMARAQEGTPDPAVAAPLLAVLHSRLLRLRHDADDDGQTLHRYAADAGLPRWVREQVVTEQVRVAFSRSHPAAGLRELDQLDPASPRRALLHARAGVLGLPDAPGGGDPPGGSALPRVVAVEAEIVRACALADAGAGPAAVATLERALELAAPDSLRWPFLDSPPQVRRLLRTSPRLGTLGTWLSPSSAPAPVPAPRDPAAARPAADGSQELSERELEVLRHLAEMLSTPEIAATMFVSVNTVRTHIRSILRKLEVGRRNEAVRRGRELGII